jgi:hypothetical protein
VGLTWGLRLTWAVAVGRVCGLWVVPAASVWRSPNRRLHPAIHPDQRWLPGYGGYRSNWFALERGLDEAGFALHVTAYDPLITDVPASPEAWSSTAGRAGQVSRLDATALPAQNLHLPNEGHLSILRWRR